MIMTDIRSLEWDEIDYVKFEELICHLLGEIGFTNVDWRKGTPEPSTSPDSGRDIEAQLRKQDPDGDEYFEDWFVQAKHYKSAVSVSKFKDAIDWAEAELPDVLLVVVSGSLSNSARKWLETYDRKRSKSFRIKYWERPTLERLLGEHADVRNRFFPEGPTEASSKEPRSVDDPIIMSRPEGQLLRDIEEMQEKADTALRE